MNRKRYEKKCRAFWFAFRAANKEAGLALDVKRDTWYNHKAMAERAKQSGGYAAMWEQSVLMVKNNDFRLISRASEIMGL